MTKLLAWSFNGNGPNTYDTWNENSKIFRWENLFVFTSEPNSNVHELFSVFKYNNKNTHGDSTSEDKWHARKSSEISIAGIEPQVLIYA